MTLNFDAYVNSILHEGVVDDLFKDPINNELEFDDVIDKFRRSGGRVLGTGLYATTLTHKDWNYVLKLFHNDSSYVTYARYCYRNQDNPCVPRMLDMPRKIIPNYTRNGLEKKFLYYVKMEKLEDMSDNSIFQKMYEFIEINFHSLVAIAEEFSMDDVLSLNIDIDSLDNTSKKNIMNALIIYKGHFPWIIDYIILLFDIYVMSKKIGARMDLHEGNVMMRKNAGKDTALVITDPLAYGRDKDVNKRDIYQLIRTLGLYRDDALSIKGGKNVSRKKLTKNISKMPSAYR